METNLTKLEQAVIRVLVEKATSKDPLILSNIAREIGSSKGLRKVIRDLRIKGYPICQNGYGFYYARTTIELGNYVKKLELDIKEQQEELTGLHRSFGAVGIGLESQPVFTKRMAVRKPGGVVGYEDFKLDAAGQPIIPPGTQLL